MASFSVLKSYDLDKAKVRAIHSLLSQLSKKLGELEPIKIMRKLENPHLVILVAVEDEKIVGMASICFIDPLSHLSARIEDVVVDKHCRGRGIANRLMNGLIAIARDRDAVYIELTSKPERNTTNFYTRLGFEKISCATDGGTDLFRLYL